MWYACVAYEKVVGIVHGSPDIADIGNLVMRMKKFGVIDGFVIEYTDSTIDEFEAKFAKEIKVGDIFYDASCWREAHDTGERESAGDSSV